MVAQWMHPSLRIIHLVPSMSPTCSGIITKRCEAWVYNTPCSSCTTLTIPPRLYYMKSAKASTNVPTSVVECILPKCGMYLRSCVGSFLDSFHNGGDVSYYAALNDKDSVSNSA